MIALIIVSIYVYFIALCIGSAYARVFIKNISDYKSTDIYFLGLCMANAFFTLWSLFLPTGITSTIVLFCVCLLYFIIDRKYLVQNIFRLFSRKNALFLFITMVIALILNGIVPPRNYDSGLYHIQAIKWIEIYKVVPGLGNLHDRFAFNPNFFSLAAGCTFRSVFGQPVYAINLVTLLVFFSWLIDKFINASNIAKAIFWGCTALMLIHFAFFQLSSPTPDILSVTLSFYLFVRLYETLNKESAADSIFFIPVLCIYLVTVKLSMIPILLVGLVAFVKSSYKPRIKGYVSLFLILSIITVPWLVRFYYLSGYILYPFPGLDLFNPAWKIPVQEVANMKAIVGLSNKYPGQDPYWLLTHPPAGWSFIEWLKKQPDMLYKLLVVAAVLSPLHVIGLWLSKRASKISIIWVLGFIGMVFFITSAPDMRFGLSYLLICAFIPLMSYPDGGRLPLQPVKLLFHAAIAFGFVFSALHCVYKFSFYKANSSKVALKGYSAKDMLLTSLPVKDAEITLNNEKIIFDSVLVNGTKIIYPANDERCFDESLPCSRQVPGKIRLLGRKVEDGIGAVE